MNSAKRVQRAIDAETAKLHDADKRQARAEQWTAKRVAFLKGDRRPPQR